MLDFVCRGSEWQKKGGHASTLLQAHLELVRHTLRQASSHNIAVPANIQSRPTRTERASETKRELAQEK